ncbi:MAG: SCO family protein [Burkholderiales bacterium]
MAKSLLQGLEPSAGDSGLLKTFSASLLVLLIGLGGLLYATEGGRAYTTETLRRAAVDRGPQSIPDLQLVDGTGRRLGLHAMLASDGRVRIVDFIYTRCQTVCTSLASVTQRLQADILAQQLERRVAVLSISFDPEADDPPALKAYAGRLRMDPAVWQAVSLAQPRDRRLLLDAFGIMVVPAPLGEFEHNAALHIVDASGRLVRIVDADAPGEALAAALAVGR